MALNIGWTEAQSPQFAALGVVSQSQTSLVADLTFLNNGSSSVTASKPVSYPSPIAAACTTAYDYKNGVIFAAAGNSLMQIATNGSALKRVHLSDSQYFPTNLAVPAVGDERVLWSIGLDNSTDLITLAFIDSNTGNVFNQTPLILLQDITPCATEFSASGMFYYAYVFGNPFSGWDGAIANASTQHDCSVARMAQCCARARYWHRAFVCYWRHVVPAARCHTPPSDPRHCGIKCCLITQK